MNRSKQHPLGEEVIRLKEPAPSDYAGMYRNGYTFSRWIPVIAPGSGKPRRPATYRWIAEFRRASK